MSPYPIDHFADLKPINLCLGIAGRDFCPVSSVFHHSRLCISVQCQKSDWDRHKKVEKQLDYRNAILTNFLFSRFARPSKMLDGSIGTEGKCNVEWLCVITTRASSNEKGCNVITTPGELNYIMLYSIHDKTMNMCWECLLYAESVNDDEE